MTKLTKEQIKQLPEGRTVQHVRLARIMSPVINGEEQREVFRGQTEVYLRKRETAYRRGRELHPAGEIVELTTGDGSWAGATEQDIEPNGSIVVEDYVMEIFVAPPAKPVPGELDPADGA